MTYTSKPITQNFIDFHTHLLPGLDDGAADMDEAVKMAGILAASGFTGACCTPHLIRGCHAHDSYRMETAVGKIQGMLDMLGIDLRLYAGREYYLDEFLMGFMDNPVQVGGGYILVEIPGQGTPEMVKDILYRVRCKGYVPLIAHPERCNLLESPAKSSKGLMEWFRFRRSRGRVVNVNPATRPGHSKHNNENSNPDSSCLLDYLKNLNCLFQANIGSFAGIYGEGVRRRAVRFLEDGLYNCLGSDAHCSSNLGEWLDIGLREIERTAGREGQRKLLNGLPVESEA